MLAASGQPGPTRAASASPASASAEPTQPPTIQRRIPAGLRPPNALPPTPTRIMPGQHAAMLHARQLRRLRRA